MQWDKLLLEQRYIDNEQTEETTIRNDYDRIICSTLFRRLQDKAQVFPLDEDDYVRTRLTHSLEVSAIGKRLGEYVYRKLKSLPIDGWFEHQSENRFSDILLCAGLIHDIGNPPFGHFGEYAIREWFQKKLGNLYLGNDKVTDILNQWQINDLYSFEGNAQSVRLLSSTPYIDSLDGFNLTYSVLGSIIKYPISSIELQNKDKKTYKKFGYYYSEKDLFEDMCNTLDMKGSRHPLSYLLEAADDIAYRTSDLEDALVKKVITYQQIEEGLNEYICSHINESSLYQETVYHMKKLMEYYEAETIKNRRKPELVAVQKWNQYIQSIMIKDAGDGFIMNYTKIMNGEYEGDLFSHTPSGNIIKVISSLCEKYIYTSSIKTRTELFGRRVINSLLDEFIPAAIVYDTDNEISFINHRIMDTVSDFYKSMYHKQKEGKSEQERLYLRILMITDYISGMTDNYAKRLYRELFV